MQDIIEPTQAARVRPDQDVSRTRANSRESGQASDATAAPPLRDDPAPLSDALRIPALIGETPKKDDSQRRVAAEAGSRLPGSSTTVSNDSSLRPASPGKGGISGWDIFGRDRSSSQNAPQNSNRATTPADPPREDAGTLIGVPSNHQQTEISGRLAKLDKIALALGATMTIGPLFAAMVSRSMG